MGLVFPPLAGFFATLPFAGFFLSFLAGEAFFAGEASFLAGEASFLGVLGLVGLALGALAGFLAGLGLEADLRD